MATKISRMHLNTELKKTSPLGTKVEVFAERVRGWQIEVALDIERQITMANGRGVMGHAAYALIAVYFSYFEMLGQFLPARAATAPLGTFRRCQRVTHLSKGSSTSTPTRSC